MRVARIAAVSSALAVLVALAADTGAQHCATGKLRLYTSWPMQGAMIPEGQR